MSFTKPSNIVYALVDCNSFYTSCEKAFKPSLKGQPVIVLSNNDGCCVAISREAKKLGIPFGKPYFEIKDLIDRHGITVFSSNYELYGDLSQRVMDTLAHFSPNLEVYSIDEAFLRLDQLANVDYLNYGKLIKETVMQWVGIPVSVGIGATKTLAKLANDIAKNHPTAQGVFEINAANLNEVLGRQNVEDVWGIGTQKKILLNRHNIITAWQLAHAPEKWLQKNLSIVGLRTALELQGINCLSLEEIQTPKKGICSSRSFGHDVTQLSDLREAIATYVSRAAKKLRSQNSVCRLISIFIATNAFKDIPQYSNSMGTQLPIATDSTMELIYYAHALLDQIYKPGFQYKKSGVMLFEISSNTAIQQNLFYPTAIHEKERALMGVMDSLNQRYGANTLFVAATGIKQEWKMIRNLKSPGYTTRWDELPIAKA